MTALMAWPQGGRIAYNTDDTAGQYTVREAIHRAKQAADADDPETAHTLSRAIARGWHLPPAVAA